MTPIRLFCYTKTNHLTQTVRVFPSSPALEALAARVGRAIFIRREGQVSDLIESKDLTVHVVASLVAAKYVEKTGNSLSELLALVHETDLFDTVINLLSEGVSEKAIAVSADYVCSAISQEGGGYAQTSSLNEESLQKLTTALFQGGVDLVQFSAILDGGLDLSNRSNVNVSKDRAFRESKKLGEGREIKKVSVGDDLVYFAISGSRFGSRFLSGAIKGGILGAIVGTVLGGGG